MDCLCLITNWKDEQFFSVIKSIYEKKKNNDWKYLSSEPFAK